VSLANLRQTSACDRKCDGSIRDPLPSLLCLHIEVAVPSVPSKEQCNASYDKAWTIAHKHR
jgi:hypothetical protein